MKSWLAPVSDAKHIFAIDQDLSMTFMVRLVFQYDFYGKACFEGCQIVNWDLLTKLGLQEPWRIADGDKVINCFYHHFLLIHNSLYISKTFLSQKIQGLNRVPN